MGRLPLKRAIAALVALAIGPFVPACRCGQPERPPLAAPGSPETSPEATGAEPAPEPIPRATRNDLPEAVPALTMTITRDAVELDDAALIATWPPTERARVPEAALHVRAEVSGPTPGYRIPEIAAGFERMTEIERTRAGAAITPTAFAVRVEPEVPWRRVIDALYSGANSGWSEPRFVLRSSDGARDVYLSMPVPAHRPSEADRRAEAEVERASEQVEQLLRRLEGTEAPTAEGGRDAPAPPLPTDVPAPLHVVITDQRTVRVSIGARPLAPGCASVHDAAIDVVPSIDPAAIARCLDAARGAGPPISGARFSSDGTLPFRDIVPVLELLRARYDYVELVAPL